MATKQPLPRAWHAAVGVGSKLYVWGGKGDKAIRSTALEIFDVPSIAWETAQVLHSFEMSSELHSMAVTSDGETSYTFGGEGGSSQPYNTLFKVTPSQHLCQELHPTSSTPATPEGTVDSCIVQYQDKLVLHGGYRRRTKELHVFDLRESECEFWNQMHDI